MNRVLPFILVGAAASAPLAALAQSAETPTTSSDAVPAPPPGEAAAPPPPADPVPSTQNVQPAQVAEAPAPPQPPVDKPAFKITPLGYVEAHYAYNFNRPSNGITNYRGFDNRHNTFTLANAVLGVNAETGPITTRVVLQIGSTPSSYYAGEPAFAGAGGANASSSELWKYLQEANIAWKAPVGRGLLLQFGLVPSPIGYESFAVKDNWNYSRSNLFFGLPYYHAGLRATYEWTDRLSTTFSVFNGWNSVVDNNEEKSIQANVTYVVPDKLRLQLLYFGGIERTLNARPEGPYWRHHFDAVGQVDATPWLSFAAQADYGFENNRIGNARWWAGALYARVKPIDRVYVALRGDRFTEHLGGDGTGRLTSPVFWNGVEWVSSGTATLDVRPHDQISVCLEYRHDVADSPLYFGRDVAGDGSAASPYVPNARTQDTLLLGATAWF